MINLWLILFNYGVNIVFQSQNCPELLSSDGLVSGHEALERAR